MLTVASVNVNGIRAAARRGMGEWLRRRGVDVLCLQEVRADDDTLRAVLADLSGDDAWHLVHAEPEGEGTKGRAGVAVASRLPVTAGRVGLGESDADGRFSASGRWVEADLRTPDGTDVTVVSAYIHSGEAGTPKQDDKMALLGAMTGRMTALRGASPQDAAHVLVTGDLNVGHRELDIRNWRGNRGKAGFLPEERAVLDDLLAVGWVDVARALAGEVDGPYSWWSWRGQAFDKDTGWRIDYHLASPALGSAARTCDVDRASSYAARFSDHAPVVAGYAV